MLRRLASEAYGDVLGIDLREWEDSLSGGKADRKHPTDFPIDALVKGMGVEKEHTDDKNLALEIVMDHLSEREDYYDMLKKVEGGVEDAGEQSQTTPLSVRPNGLLNPEHPSAVPQNYPGISGSPEKLPERFEPPLSQKVADLRVCKHYLKDGDLCLSSGTIRYLVREEGQDVIQKQKVRFQDVCPLGGEPSTTGGLTYQNSNSCSGYE